MLLKMDDAGGGERVGWVFVAAVVMMMMVVMIIVEMA